MLEQFPNRRESLPIPSLGEHAIVTGQTGSGKTETICQLLVPITQNTQAIIVDTKGDERFEYLPASIYKAPGKILKDGRSPIVVYRPDRNDADPEKIDVLLSKLYDQKRNLYVYIDETYQVSPTAKPGRGLGDIIMRGRRRWDGKKTSRMSVICGTQRPVWVPKFCFTEARHYYIHNLSDDDTDVIAGYIGRSGNIILKQPAKGHEFYYYENASDKEGRDYGAQKFRFNLDEQPITQSTELAA